ncbi:MAG TPA: hypothetical protein VHE80_07625 [Acidimicrobiales bacterium]|nr:hypothetical protein [Acidimicrobiales bacterium]
MKAGEPTRCPDTSLACSSRATAEHGREPSRVVVMKKLLLLVILVALGAIAAKKLRVD